MTRPATTRKPGHNGLPSLKSWAPPPPLSDALDPQKTQQPPPPPQHHPPQLLFSRLKPVWC